MQKPHDERAKLIAEQALDPLGDAVREKEIPASDAQHVDIWFARRFFPKVLPSYLRLLDMLFSSDCLIEVFSEAVSLLDFWASHRKQCAWQRMCQQAAEQQTGQRGKILAPMPWLWVISAGRPDTLFATYDIVPKPGFPGGVYAFGKGFEIGLVVLSELPLGRETLLLRMMGTGPMLQQALEEMRQVPADDPDAPALRRFVACLRHTISHATNISKEEREDVMTKAWADFERFEQELVETGRREERDKALKALQEAAVKISRKRFGEDQLGQARIARLQSPEVLQALLVRLATAPTLADALTGLPAD